MKRRVRHTLAIVLALTIVALSGSSALAGTCNLGCAACTSYCAGGCQASQSVWHSSWSPCHGGGSFDLTGTEFENTCGDPENTGACTVSVPPLRFWAYGVY